MSATYESLRACLADPRFRDESLRWLAGLADGSGGYRLWQDAPVHPLSTAFAVFLRELHGDLPLPSSAEADNIIERLLSWRDTNSGLFDINLDREALGPRHDREYIALQQSHFALQALRLLGKPVSVIQLLHRWENPAKLRDYFTALDWRDPWRESNKVMFALYLLEHEYALTGDERWLHLYHTGLDWLREVQDPETGLWGIKPRCRVYNAIYGAYHFIFFFLASGMPVPRGERLLYWTRKLQTSQGFFAHSRGGGACEDFDCVDLLVKLGDTKDEATLLRCASAVIADRNMDGGFCWARKQGGLGFVIRNFKPSLSPGENLRLLRGRLLDLAGKRDTWTYSGLESLRCPTDASDIWSTWFRTLILAEIDERVLHSGTRWQWRSFPSLGWHKPKGKQ